MTRMMLAVRHGVIVVFAIDAVVVLKQIMYELGSQMAVGTFC